MSRGTPTGQARGQVHLDRITRGGRGRIPTRPSRRVPTNLARSRVKGGSCYERWGAFADPPVASRREGGRTAVTRRRRRTASRERPLCAARPTLIEDRVLVAFGVGRGAHPRACPGTVRVGDVSPLGPCTGSSRSRATRRRLVGDSYGFRRPHARGSPVEHPAPIEPPDRWSDEPTPRRRDHARAQGTPAIAAPSRAASAPNSTSGQAGPTPTGAAESAPSTPGARAATRPTAKPPVVDNLCVLADYR